MPTGKRVYQSVLTGDWKRLGDAFANLSIRFPQAMQSALVEEGEFYRRKIVEGIREQAPGGQRFKPLSPVTLALRRLMGFRGTKALIRTGELRNNVTNVAKPGEVFVGVLYTARGEDGRSLADIGKIHEFGAVIRSAISKARMRLIAQALRKAGARGRVSGNAPGVGLVRIPARPFIRPVFDMYGGRRGAERYMARVARKLGGLLGVISHPDLGGRSALTIPERFAGGGVGHVIKMARTGRVVHRPLLKSPLKLKKAPRVPRVKTPTRPKLAKSKAARVKPARAKAVRGTRKVRFSKKPIGAASKMPKTRFLKPRIRRVGPRRAWRRPPLPRPQQHNAHVKAFRAKQRRQWRRQNPQHNAHVKAHRPQQNAHVKAFRKQQAKGQHNAHVKAWKSAAKPKQHSAHVKAFRQWVTQNRADAHVRAFRRERRKAGPGHTQRKRRK